MSIQIVGLRPYWNKSKEILDIKEKFFDVKARSVESLFANIDKIIQDIPEEERWNLYWTASHCEIGTRNMHRCQKEWEPEKGKPLRGQDIICFDVDGIDEPRIDEYPSLIAEAIGVPLKECVVVYSGNGVQLTVKVSHHIGYDEYFKNYREHYKYWCDRINASMLESGLNGNADTTVFSAARLLRLPLTKNIKPLKNANVELCKEHGIEPELKIKEATLEKGDLGRPVFNLFVEGLKDKQRQMIQGQRGDYGRPDKKTIMEECSFMKEALDTKGAEFDEPQWRASLNIASYFEDDHETCHKISEGHPEYNYEATELKIGLAREGASPHLCSHINQVWSKCSGCKHYQKVNSPISIKGKMFFIEEMENPIEAKKMNEMQVVYKLLQEFKIAFDPATSKVDPSHSDLIKQDGDVYAYKEGYWKMMDDSFDDKMYRAIEVLTHYKEKHSTVESILKKFHKFIPEPPATIRMKRPTGDRLCLNNGTLHLIKKDSGYGLELRPHNRTDYMVNKINLDYDETFTEQNTMFNEMLERVFENDPDKEDKILAIQEMMGGCLMPKFPKIYFLHGEAGCGKSTLMICLSNLLSNENIGRLDPTCFKGFLLEPLIGKMVNMVMDIEINAPIGVSVLKTIEDRVPYMIQRKGKKNINEPLPALHVFGGNGLPKNYETDNTAFDRRAVFIKFLNVMTKKDDDGNYSHDRNFGNDVFNHNPQGVLNFALQGLLRVCNRNGQYLQPKSGQETLNEWISEFDAIQHFLNDIAFNEVEGYEDFDPIIGDDLKCERKYLWPVFTKWQKNSGYSKGLTKSTFYKGLSKKLKIFKTNGYFYVKGIGNKNEERGMSQENVSESEVSKEGY